MTEPELSDDSGRVALVTGAARGIGAATVGALCDQGYRVLAVDSCASDGPARPAGIDYRLASKADLDAVQRSNAGRVRSCEADVRDPDAMEAAAQAAIDAFGRLDVVVAAAAVIAGGTPLWETPREQVDTLWDVDVRGVWNTAAACVPHLLRNRDPGGCRIVAIASAAGSRGLFHLAAYSMAKHAVVGLVKGLAADLVGTGVTAVAVSPGSTRTAMLAATATAYGIADVEDFAASQLIRRLLEPAEVAATIAFCCSIDGAALNGTVVHADGGFVP